MSYTVEELQKLMESFRKSGLTRFRYETPEETLSFRNEPRNDHSTDMPVSNQGNREGRKIREAESSGSDAENSSAEAGEKKTGTKEETSTEGKSGSKEESAANLVLVKAPIAGIFYRASKPGEKPYVEEGQKVKKGDIVGLVEAMKMMNEIPSPCDGVVRKIKANDAVFVEYDALLLTIEEN